MLLACLYMHIHTYAQKHSCVHAQIIEKDFLGMMTETQGVLSTVEPRVSSEANAVPCAEKLITQQKAGC